MTAPGTGAQLRIVGFGYAIAVSAAGVRITAVAFHFFVNLRTFDHFEASLLASSERTRQKYAPFGSILLLT